MADYTQNLKSKLQSDATIASFVASRIAHNNMPTQPDRKLDYIWLRRSGQRYAHTLDEAAGSPPMSVFYDVECCSLNLDRSTKIADAVRAIFPFAGTFGDSTVKAAFVDEQDEDYVPLNASASIGIHVQSLQVEIMP